MNKDPYDIDKVKMELTVASGNISEAARSMGKARAGLKRYIDKTPDALHHLESLREGVLDKAESNVFLAVETGDLVASKFLLTTLAKDRGYVSGSEISGPNGSPVRTLDVSPENLIRRAKSLGIDPVLLGLSEPSEE